MTLISSYSPHVGALWEVCVKFVKHNLKRVMGNSEVTFKEMNTSFYQIKAALNSRPMERLSVDPANLTA